MARPEPNIFPRNAGTGGRSCGVNLDGLCSRLRMSSKWRVESLALIAAKEPHTKSSGYEARRCEIADCMNLSEWM